MKNNKKAGIFGKIFWLVVLFTSLALVDKYLFNNAGFLWIIQKIKFIGG